MSTLGDLLAEHTVLPGNAVDHLHAVVGEWQLLADLSFADYLMWVRRDDGVLVCVAQVRPNTAPTVLLADAVGTMADADQMPLVTDAFKSGTIGRRKRCGTRGFARSQRGGRSRALQERSGGGADASDRAGRAQGQPAGDRLPRLRRRPAAHAVRRHLPQRRRPGDVTVQPARRRRVHPPRRGPASSPSPAPTRSRRITGWA